MIISSWYDDDGTTSGITSTDASSFVVRGDAVYYSSAGTVVNVKVDDKKGLHPNLVFKFIKKNKMSLLGKRRYENRIKKIEKLALKHIDEGHNALAEKFLNKLSEEVKLAELTGAGVKMFVLKSLVNKHKHNIRGGHISDTPFEKYTKTIPSSVLKTKKKFDDLKVFDDYVIYHYWNEKAEEKKKKKEKVSSEERESMRDPILFGVCKDVPDKLFFVDDWDDEYCDLTFDELVDKLPIEDEEVEIPRKPDLTLD